MSSTTTKSTIVQTAEIKVWGHASILYWWPVWLYGFVCAAITAALGKDMVIGGFPVRVFEQSWLGLSFVLLVLFVITFSALRVRGYIIIIAFLIVGLGAELLINTGRMGPAMSWFVAPVVFMNLAFYLIFSTVLLTVWLLAVFVIDRLTYWRFMPNQLQEVHVLDHVDDKVYPMYHMAVYRRPVDFLRKVLGLFSTGDLLVRPEKDAPPLVIPNVWKVDKKLQKITEFMQHTPHNKI